MDRVLAMSCRSDYALTLPANVEGLLLFLGNLKRWREWAKEKRKRTVYGMSTAQIRNDSDSIPGFRANVRAY